MRGVSSLTLALVLPLLVLIVLPIAMVFYGSLLSAPPGAAEAVLTLENWQTVYLSAPYLAALANTVLLGLVSAALSLLVGGALAWIIARTDMPGRRSLALLLLLPMMISGLVTTLAWIALAAPNAGFINVWVRGWSGIRTLLNIYSFGGIVLVHVLHYGSFAFLALFAALRSIDGAMEEASAMVGAGRLRTALSITLPLITPTLATAFLMIFVFVAENFPVPTLLGSPVGFQTLPSLIYQNMAVTPAHPTLAAASGTVLLWIALIGTILQQRVSRQEKRFVTVSGKGSRPPMMALGRWRYVCLGFVLVFLLLAVVLPYLALLLGSFMNFLTPNLKPSVFTWANYRTLWTGDAWAAAVNSLLLSGGGGLVLTAVYVLISSRLAELGSNWRRASDFISIIPSAIPALVLGMGLIWTFVGLPLPIYGTMGILIIAYFLRNLGTGVRHANNAFAQISGDLAEAARINGATRLQALRDIVLPIARPAMLSLWTTLFIFIFMEVSATILLYAPSTRTLPTVLWNHMASGSQPRAFAIAVAQASLIFAILFITDRRLGTLRSNFERVG